MLTIREEVQALARATERVLSPIMLGKALNDDERELIAMCAQNLVEKYARAEGSAEEGLHSEKEALLHQSQQVTVETLAVIERTRIEMQASKTAVAQMRERINGSRKA
jgi:hypothetical protein